MSEACSISREPIVVVSIRVRVMVTVRVVARVTVRC